MHVLFMVNNYPTMFDPVDHIFYADQAQALRRAGVKVGVVVEARTASMVKYVRHYRRLPPLIAKEADTAGFPVYRAFWGEVPRSAVGFRVFSKMRLAKLAFNRYCREQGTPDVIHAQNTLYAGYMAARIAERHKIPFVVTEHFSGFLRDLVMPKQHRYVAYALEKAAMRFAVSGRLAESLKPYAGSRPVNVLPNVVDTDFFAFHPPPDTADHFEFTTAARFDENKALSVLLRAFCQAFYGKPVFLNLIGDGALRRDLESLVVELGIQDQIRFTGWLSREGIREILYHSHGVVSSSRVETFGLSLLEALACGRPVVSTRSGGPEGFVTVDNGLLVPVDDVAALALALQQMRQHYYEYNLAAIREMCVREFSEQAFVDKLLNIYQQVQHKVF